MNKNIFIWMFGLILLSSFAFAIQTPTYYFSFDNDNWTGSEYLEFYNNVTLTSTNEVNVTGKINQAVSYTNGYSVTNKPNIFSSTGGTIVGWMKKDDSIYNHRLISNRNGQARPVEMFLSNVDTIAVNVYGSNVDGQYSNYTENRWYHISVTWNATHTILYIDGVEYDVETATPFNYLGSATNFEIGRSPLFSTEEAYADIDDLAIWQTDLKANEILQIYNEGVYNSSIYVPPTSIVTLLTPVDNDVTNLNDINFSYSTTILDPSCELYFGNFSGTWANNGTIVDNRTVTLAEGEYFWNVDCNGTFATSNFTFTIDQTNPIISTTFIDGSDYYRSNLTGTFNFSDEVLLYSVNISIDDSQIHGITNINATTYQYNLSQEPQQYGGGEHTLSVRVADGHTAKKLKDSKAYNPTNGLFNDKIKYKLTKPYDLTNIEIKSKNYNLLDSWDYIEKTDRFSEIFIPKNPKATQTFIVEADVPIKIVSADGHYNNEWLVIGDHWKDFVLEGEDDVVQLITRINDYKVEVTLANIKHPEKLTFESTGDLNIVTQNYTFYVLNATETYEPNIVKDFETEYNLTLLGIVNKTRNALLEVDGINYSVTTSFQNSTEQRFTKSLTFTDSVSNFATKGHNWWFNLSDNSYTNTTNQTQYIFNPEFGLCEDNKTYPAINFTFKDENSGSLIASEFTYTMNATDGVNNIFLSGGNTGNTSLSFCTNIPPQNLTYSWSLPSILSLSKDGYVTRVFSFEADPLTASNNPTTNKSLFLIQTNASTTVNYRWYTKYLQLIEGTMLIYKCEVDGTQSLVESTPIISASTSANIELLTQAYSYRAIVNGVVYEDTNSYSRCHVESRSDPAPFYVDTEEDIDTVDTIGLLQANCQITRTTNSTAQMSWTFNPESTSTIQGCMQGYRETLTGKLLVFENCSTSSPIDVTLVNNGNNYVVGGFLNQSGNYVQCEGTLSVTPETFGSGGIFGMSGLLASIFLLIAVGLFFTSSGEISLIASCIAIIMSAMLGIYGRTFNMATGITIMAILILAAIVGRASKR